MRSILSLLLLSIGLGVPIFGFNSDFTELPRHSAIRELASARNAYQHHMMKSVGYRLNILIPGFMRRSVNIIRTYDPSTGQHEVIPKYSIKFWPGIAKESGRPLDFHLDALQARAYFNVRLTTGAVAVTRDGRFRIDHEGRLVTISGNYPVLADDGGYLILENDRVTVSRSGVLYNEGRRVGRLKITVFDYIEDMKKAFESISANFFILKFDIPKQEYQGGSDELPYAFMQGFVTQGNAFDSKDSGLYRNFHTASHSAIVQLMGTYDKINQNMIAP
jgi:hypothetical protein